MDAIDNRPDSSRRGFFQVMILGFFALFGLGCIVHTRGPRPRGRTTRVRRSRGRRGATVRTSRRTQRGRRGRGATVRTSRRRTTRRRRRR